MSVYDVSRQDSGLLAIVEELEYLEIMAAVIGNRSTCIMLVKKQNLYLQPQLITKG